MTDICIINSSSVLQGAKFGNTKEVQKLRVYRNKYALCTVFSFCLLLSLIYVNLILFFCYSHVVVETSQTISDAPFGDHFTVEVSLYTYLYLYM
jgi:hypothetical protein